MRSIEKPHRNAHLLTVLLFLLSLSLPLPVRAGDPVEGKEPSERGTKDVPAFAVPVGSLEEAVRTGRLPETVWKQARKQGAVHVLVQLALPEPYRPDSLLDEAAAEKQRRAIADAQDALGRELWGQLSEEPRRMRYTPYASIWSDEKVLLTLVASKQVRRIQENAVQRAHLANSIDQIDADTVQASLGPLGAGQTIAILDTGVASDHPFLRNRVVSEACYSDDGGSSTRDSVCPNGREATTVAGSGAPCTFAGCDHGTHVAGIAAGRDDGTIGYDGVAGAARIIAIQVFHRQNDEDACEDLNLTAPCPLTWISDVVQGLERVYELRDTFAIASANMSLGGGFYTSQSTCDDDNEAYRDIAATLWGAGIVPVASAGNSAMQFDDAGNFLGNRPGIGRPACVSNVVSVGALTRPFVGAAAGAVAGFSQYSSFTDLLAPGVGIVSSVSPPGDGGKSGTSMAAPHVAGALAALAAVAPGGTPAVLTSALTGTGLAVADTRNGTSAPAIRLDRAVEQRLGRPLAPTGLRVAAITGTTADIAWDNQSPSATEFRVEATPPDTIQNPPRRTTTSASSATVGALRPDLTYTVIVRACAAGVCSDPSEPLTFRTLDTLPPEPVDFRVTFRGPDRLDLAWDVPAGNPVTELTLGHDTLGGQHYRTLGATERTATFTGLTHDTLYRFWIRTHNQDGRSEQVQLSARTLSLGPPPAAPTNLRECVPNFFRNCLSLGTLFLWRDNATTETRYEFEWSRVQVGVPPWQAHYASMAIGANRTSYDLKHLVSGALYYVRVRACNAAGCSAYSNTLTYGAP
jgi:subtilisin family serine protease